MDAMGPIPYCALNGLLDASFPKGALNYWKAQFLTDLSDEASARLSAASRSARRRCARSSSSTSTARRPAWRQRHRLHAADQRLQRRADLAVERSARHRRVHGLVPRHLQRAAAVSGTTRYVNYLDRDEADDVAASATGRTTPGCGS